MYADANGVDAKEHSTSRAGDRHPGHPPGLRAARRRWGYKQVFIPAWCSLPCGMACLAFGGTRGWMIARRSSSVWASAPPIRVYVGYVMQGVSSERRGAAFGAILAAFDTGIGTGSTMMGWLIQRYGFVDRVRSRGRPRGACALPYFLSWTRRLRAHPPGGQTPNS